jgi:hypothetical protein
VPFKPDWSKHETDPRFDQYRERVGRLFRGHDEVGLLLVRVEPYAEVESGHLWWSRWSKSYDVLWLWTIVDGEFNDSYLPGDAVEQELHYYAAGLYDHYGETLCVRWTSAEESARLRRSEFRLC